VSASRETVMANDKTLQTYPSPEDARWIELRQRSDGLYYFQEFSDVGPSDPQYGPASDAVPGLRSGTYKTFEAAESDLVKMTPWLCAKSK
jgi:hypothetical protein